MVATLSKIIEVEQPDNMYKMVITLQINIEAKHPDDMRY